MAPETDTIQILPDHIANQIAAGEVIQRPASAVKELLENAIDAGSTRIQLIISDAGKSLVQVIDNGCGMSERDARLAFSRHATSKIREVDDLFHIQTMGFRGEALASIASVARVELRTRRPEAETGWMFEWENSDLVRQEPVAMPGGTSIAMKNLFYNVPARRNFLRSHASETRHILEEFIRVAMAFPLVQFSMVSNGQEVFHLEPGTLRQRIVQLLGHSYESRLVPVKEKTDYLDIYGFVGKPDAVKKTRGEQYFFVNSRFIRSPYLQHAVMGAFQQLIPAQSFPLFVLFIFLDPTQIDVNVHPAKQEIKFEDERIVYAFVQASVKHALAQFSITPALEFDLDPEIQQLEAVRKPMTEDARQALASGSLYRTFTQKNQAHLIEPGEKNELRHWRTFFEGADLPNQAGHEAGVQQGLLEESQPESRNFQGLLEKESLAFQPLAGEEPLQIQHRFILVPVHEGFLLIRQQEAHERVLYERYATARSGLARPIQRSLFPAVLQFAPGDSALMMELLPELELLGYLIEPFGLNSFVIQGSPADIPQGSEKTDLEQILEQVKHFSGDRTITRREKVTRALARQHAIRPGAVLNRQEMRTLIDDLFVCQQPLCTPDGKTTYLHFSMEYLANLFER